MPPASSAGKRRPTKAREITPPAGQATDREPRGARRKRETRQRLLGAALRLMAEKGMEGVAINEITEAADVGFGSFYNHFESKEAIYAAVMDWVFRDFADALDRLVQEMADPAEVVSVCARHTVLRAQRDPVWGRFLVREGYSARSLESGLGQRLLRDIRKGMESGRFKSEDPLMSFLSAGGTVLASISAWLQLGSLDFSLDDLSQRVAKSLLLSLGVRRSEAEKIAFRALPADGALPEASQDSSAI